MMKGSLARMVAACCLCVAFCCVASRAQSRAGATAQSDPAGGELLTNAAVIKLVRAGFSEKVVIAIIRSRPARFDLAPDRLIELKKGGVGEKVILAMLARGDDAALLADDINEGGSLADDPFFRDMRDPARERRGGVQTDKSDPSETNIFGSSGGTSGRTRSGGLNGGVDSDTQTTGSASVRIVRPNEGGGAPPKLERTPTLTNESVIALVEAGFSEGTIIRRVENSPADFDFAPAKLAELRRRRVTDAVINAMRAAMSDEPGAGAQRPQQ